MDWLTLARKKKNHKINILFFCYNQNALFSLRNLQDESVYYSFHFNNK